MMQAYRDDFPMLEQEVRGHPLLYLDSAATALTPEPVIDAIARFYREEYGTVHRAIYQLAESATERYNAVRQKVANFVGASAPQEIVFTKGTTDSINLVAASFSRWGLNLRDEILVAETEHHSNIVPWQLACQTRGATLRVIPVDDNGLLILDELERLLSSGSVKLVALAHMNNTLGTVHPIGQVVKMAHQWGAKVLVDGAQAAPHLPLDMQQLDVDFYAFSGHKLYGPTGIGVLYGKGQLLADLPPYQGGGDMIDAVSFEETTYHTIPERFEAGTPNIAGVMGLGAAIDYLERVGFDRVGQWERTLCDHALEALTTIEGLHILGRREERGPIIGFTVDGIHPFDLGTLLDLKGIAIRTGHLCAQPTMHRFGVSTIARASFGLYNTFEEIDRFVAELKQVLTKLR